jgi:DNA-binding CsgD family transcriptional regulator
MIKRVDIRQLQKATSSLGEAVVDPAAWPRVMEEICRAINLAGAVLLQTDVRTADVPRTESFDEPVRTYFNNGWADRDIRSQHGIPRLFTGEIVADQDLISAEQMRMEPMYNEVLYPFGFQWFAAVGFWAGPALWAFTTQRLRDEGPFEAHDKRLLAMLAPRLTETATLSTAVGRAVLSGTTNAFARIRKPALAIHRLGYVLEVNAAAAAGFDDDIRVNHQRQLVVRDKQAASKLDRLLQSIRWASDATALNAEPIVVRRSKKPPVLLRILPVDGAARNVFLGSRALIILDNLISSRAPEPRMLAEAFDLTRAEARVASMLVEGQSVTAISHELGISPNTVRTQLKSIFSKTGVHRQAELVSLLALL